MSEDSQSSRVRVVGWVMSAVLLLLVRWNVLPLFQEASSVFTRWNWNLFLEEKLVFVNKSLSNSLFNCGNYCLGSCTWWWWWSCFGVSVHQSRNRTNNLWFEADCFHQLLHMNKEQELSLDQHKTTLLLETWSWKKAGKLKDNIDYKKPQNVMLKLHCA